MCGKQYLQYHPCMPLLSQCDAGHFDHPGPELGEGLLPWAAQSVVCYRRATF